MSFMSPLARPGAPWSSALPVMRALQLACIALLLAPPVHAEAARARFGVSVTVVTPATIRSEWFPSELEISAADIKRGYVDWRRATPLIVGNISPVAFVLDVFPTSRIFSQVVISTSATDKATLGAGGGQIVGWRGSRSDDPLVLDFRFKLQSSITPGRYPWPLRVDARLDY
jgi:hypothetical protein